MCGAWWHRTQAGTPAGRQAGRQAERPQQDNNNTLSGAEAVRWREESSTVILETHPERAASSSLAPSPPPAPAPAPVRADGEEQEDTRCTVTPPP